MYMMTKIFTPTLIMFYVYILKSENDGNLYIGSTNDLKRRFLGHNSSKVFIYEITSAV